MTDAAAPKLPYFHRSLTPEDAALIGDIRPKPIAGDAANITSSGKLTASSAWNSAQTWEERNCTEWGKEKLATVIPEGEGISGSSFRVSFTALSKKEGNAHITHSRGKARFMYEWTLTVDIQAVGFETFKGSAVLSDVINDQLDDIEVELSWTGKKPMHADGKAIREMVKTLAVAKMKVFEEEYRKIDS